MKEFIVWYSNGTDKFSKEFTLDELISQLHYDEICDSPLLKDYKVIEIRQSVGKKDINNNKIYADCSIVKLGKDIGFIKYSPFLSANVFICLSSHKTEQPLMECSLFNINNMEIIDTIQENKLGLIKE